MQLRIRAGAGPPVAIQPARAAPIKSRNRSLTLKGRNGTGGPLRPRPVDRFRGAKRLHENV